MAYHTILTHYFFILFDRCTIKFFIYIHVIPFVMNNNISIKSAAVLLLLLAVISISLTYPLNRVAYAHTFSGSESAAFLALVKIIQSEAGLIQGNLPSNITLAQEHAEHLTEHLDANTTKELAERNKRVANDLTTALSDLQNTAKSKPIPAAEVIKDKVSNIGDILQEAITVRVEKDQLKNSTVKAEVTSNIVNETLEHYGGAYGIEEEGGGEQENTTTAAGHNTIVNVAEYQSAQALASKAEEMFNEAKSLISSNAMSSSSNIAKVGNDLSQLKSDIDAKKPYDSVATLIESIIQPDIKAAFNLS
jgi:hypothetical protein